jgi:predicted ATPase/class 3 adenylate cyclase
MATLPTGTVTFLFTDIEGSTRLLQELGPDRYQRLQDDHGEILRKAIAAGDGTQVRTEGDAFVVVFPSPAGAVRAAVAAQRALPRTEIRVRMGLHTGEGRLGGDDYVGIDVNRAARIAASGHGGQVLLSDATRSLVERDLPDGVTVRDLGNHRLKDIDQAERLFDLVIEGLPSTFPPLRTLDARPHNLPLQLTSFVGRETEIAETVRLLEDHRLVTLTGPGGTGKTRLALEVAGRLLPRFADGAFFVDLSPLTDPRTVPSTVVRALGAKEDPGRPPLDMLSEHLAELELLLIPDNVEHLLEAGPLLEQLLAAAPRLRVLATSRTPLGLYGEQELLVPSLALPDPRRPPELDALARYEAVALFVERAREARHDFDLTSENAPAVAEICGRLDGLPLAIELAASRIKVLSPHDIQSRLGQGLDLLASGVRNLPERQRTLRRTLEWSYGLLDGPERGLFARMSVFAGGADVEAVVAVTNPDGELGTDTLDGLAALIDSSLIRQTHGGGGESRFGMLETIREYARERCDLEWDGEGTRRRHAEHFLTLAEAAGPHLEASDQVAWLDRLDREQGNVNTALRWAIEQEPERGMRAAAAVWRFWQVRADVASGRDLVEHLLAGPVGRTGDRARAEEAAGSLAYWESDLEEAERHYREALAIFRELGDRPGTAQVTHDLAFVPLYRGTGLEESGRLFQEAIELYAEIGDDERAGRAKADLALLLMMQNDHAGALPLLEEAVSRTRERGDLVHLADDLLRLGNAHRMLGEFDEARDEHLEALEIMERMGATGGIAAVLELMASIDSDQDRYQRALRLYGAGEAVAESVGGRDVPTNTFLFGDPVGDSRKAIGDEAVEAALAEGRRMTREEAVAYARSADD